ncbi:hypothetical protein POM88_055002 [Heracleum sosnowskyi]|uniref:Uncharacterized protein n=1 Tax=Heracleum sosnowskyi TaxID=360622 RepID=A0AAD8GLA9_9APIA|nr:hypothetical protein POM88_055002 [Heracleum sosnowskyi]
MTSNRSWVGHYWYVESKYLTEEWDLHGEKDVPRFETGTSSGNVGYNDDNMYDVRDMLRDFVDANAHFENFEEEPNAKGKDFYKMVDNASIPIYPNNKESTLSVVNKLLHWKHKHNCSNTGFAAMPWCYTKRSFLR